MASLDDLFYPKSLAIVGASTSPLNFGSGFFTIAMEELGYEGKVYYINPKHVGELINGEKIIGSLDEVEGPIDVVYSCIRASLVPELVRQCVRRGDKFIIVFTSGFSELLTNEAIALENELRSIIRGSSTRIVGPNCLGPYNPSMGVGWNTGISEPILKKGNVAFASQSGGHASTLLRIAAGRAIYFTLGLSFGNQIDLNSLDALEYFAQNQDTEVIALYMEDTGSAKGSDFFKALKKITPKKPVIIWKGGQTESGARAAASHTGAMSGSFNMWRSMTKQAGSMIVRNGDEFWDAIHLLATLPKNKWRICKNLGLLIPGGGHSVEGTDAFTQFGFNVPVLTRETQDKIANILPSVNTSVKNPIDLGASGMLETVFFKTLKFMAEDPNVDLVINFQPIDWIAMGEAQFVGVGYSRYAARSYGRLVKKLEKPFIQLSPIFNFDKKTAQVFSTFIEILRQKGIPHFTSMRRLAVALSHLNEYVQFLKHDKK
ncbi:MAG: CoA-binding protein [Candidatus Helarchaeota archaeon]|nr:CoA-binding protein [Candidatus Helarchaeota archaeon]